MLKESPEHAILEHMRQLGTEDLADLILDVSKYQVFTEDAATVVIAPRGQLGGIVVWNLEPGQENDYHMHPANEHLTFVVEGEMEFTLGDREPEIVRPGQLVVIPATMPHGIRNLSEKRASYVAVTSPGPYEKILVERPSRG
jgi:quercetin dioxygenase-like cupin family protein